tara:strand:+ start:81 stop:581 length:501 start_codon:yes stop_codon:yes gene_type:complete
MTDITDFLDGSSSGEGEYVRRLLDPGHYKVTVLKHQMVDTDFGKSIMLVCEEEGSKNWINTFFGYETPEQAFDAKGLSRLRYAMKAFGLKLEDAVIKDEGKSIFDAQKAGELCTGHSATAELAIKNNGKENIIIKFIEAADKHAAPASPPPQKAESSSEDTSFLDD